MIKKGGLCLSQYLYPEINTNNFTRRNPIGFSPSDFDLLLWYRATDVIKDGSDNVSQWTDLSGNDYHLLQASAGLQPLWVNNVLNGQPVLRSTGAKKMYVNLGTTYVQPITYFIVWKVTTNTGNPQVPFDAITTGIHRLMFDPSNNIRGFGSSPNYLLYANGSPTMPFSVHSFVVNGVSSELNLNNILKASGYAGSDSISDFQVFNALYASRPLVGDIAEIIAVNELLNTSDKLSFGSYLKGRYNI